MEFIVQNDESNDSSSMVGLYYSIEHQIISQNVGENSGINGNNELALENASGETKICLAAGGAHTLDGLYELATVVNYGHKIVLS